MMDSCVVRIWGAMSSSQHVRRIVLGTFNNPRSRFHHNYVGYFNAAAVNFTPYYGAFRCHSSVSFSSREVDVTLPTGKKIKVPTGLFINNEFVDSVDKKYFETINPTDGKVITKVAEASEKDVDIAVEAAAEAFKVWQCVGSSERGRLINKVADLIERDLDDLAALEALNSGKPYHECKTVDLNGTISCYRYYAGWSDKIHGKTIETNQDKFVYTRREPIGVCGAIIPWNFPLVMQAWKLAPALACGNTVVLKSSELTPLTALKVAALFKEAGFPKGVVNIVNGYGKPTGTAIAHHMKVNKIAFTGSTAVGKLISKASADSNMKKVSLELGGKSPNIIFADADLDQAVKWAHTGIFYNQGQNCCAGSRVYVEDTVYDEFLKKFKEHTERIKIGDPFDIDTYQGPQVSKQHFDRIMSYIESGKKEGAKCLTGGERHGDKGFFIKPTIFTDVNEKMTIMQEEIFGPVVAISKFSSVEEVIKNANLSKYGLAAAVFTSDITRALQISNELKAGTVWVNCYNLFDVNVPFGGYKESGIGRELGKYALDEYTQVKTVHVNLGVKRD